jgi:hypothetical protein
MFWVEEGVMIAHQGGHSSDVVVEDRVLVSTSSLSKGLFFSRRRDRKGENVV